VAFAVAGKSKEGWTRKCYRARSSLMRLRVSMRLLLSILVLAAFASVPALPPQAAHAESLVMWDKTTPMPAGATTSCMASSSGYLFCVGGDGTYYAAISSSGVGAWTKTTSYPSAAANGYEGCAIYGGYIYCAGGLPAGSSSHPTRDVYYAAISSSGVGAWTPTTPYPTVIYGESCQASPAGYIYCVGGQTAVGLGETNEVYYARLYPFGVGAWTETTSYPLAEDGAECSITGGEIYCIGGYAYPTPGYTNAAYHATISPSGIGPWNQTTNYPDNDPSACAISSGFVYCLGGSNLASHSQSSAVEYAPIREAGLGTWVPTTSYPGSPVASGCVAWEGHLYCVGGRGSTHSSTSVYFVEIKADAPPTPPKILLTLSSVAQNGSVISGYKTTVYNSDVNLSGFSPTLYTLNYSEHYMAYVWHYAGCDFVYWQDTGSTQAIRAISLTGNTTLTAVYDCNNKELNSNMTVTSVNQDGVGISGYYVTLVAGPDVLDHAFTPTTFVTTIGQSYMINASGFQNCAFLQWSDGVKANPRPFNATVAPQSLTAVYSCGTAKSSTIIVNAVNSVGSNITGYYVTIWQNGAQIGSCFSTCSFNVVNGQYQVLADSFGSETFSHWENDGSAGFETVDVTSSGTTIALTAVYNP
jgi:hypothetical protein